VVKLNYLEILILWLFVLLIDLFGQNTEWKFYTTTNSPIPSNNIHCITQDTDSNYWIAASKDINGNVGGLVKFDGKNWIVYDTLNSGLPTYSINDIEIDTEDNIWLATLGYGLVKFDGSNWTIYDTLNSGLPGNDILCIAIEQNNILWLGTYWHGLVKYDGNTWTNYTQENSGLTLNEVNEIIIDSLENKWIGTDGAGLVMFDGKNWEIINCSNFMGLIPVFGLAEDINHNIWATVGGNNNNIGFIYNNGCRSYSDTEIGFEFSPRYPFGLAVDTNDVKWMATTNGIVRFDNVSWKNYSKNNSPIPGDWTSNIFIDNKNNVWFVYANTIDNSSGLGVFNNNGITDVLNIPKSLPEEFFMYQNYPNPFNPTTKIKYTIPNVGTSFLSASGRMKFVKLKVYDILGNEVATLVNEEKQAGSYEVEFNASKLPSGVYFYRLQAGDFVSTKKLMVLK